jgi:phosphohistidine phosphatase
MKTLLLLRHAKSSWDDDSVPDHDRPLNRRGKKTAPIMGRLIQSEGLTPDRILSSTAVRARKTAEAVARACKIRDRLELVEGLYLATAGSILEEVRGRAREPHARVLLVGHNPGMEDLVEILAGRRERFPTAALAAFEIGIERWSELLLGVETKLVGLWRPKEI